MMLIAPGYIGYAPLAGQAAGAVVLVAGLLVVWNN